LSLEVGVPIRVETRAFKSVKNAVQQWRSEQLGQDNAMLPREFVMQPRHSLGITGHQFMLRDMNHSSRFNRRLSSAAIKL
jgi:hypothetical protein